jgi:hypothetical protein
MKAGTKQLPVPRPDGVAGSGWADDWFQERPPSSADEIPPVAQVNDAVVLSYEIAAQSVSNGLTVDPRETVAIPLAGQATAPLVASWPPVGLAEAPEPLLV